MPTICKYTNLEAGARCSRTARFNSEYCVFHETDVRKQVTCGRYSALLLALDRKGDGDWVGFRFPSPFKTSKAIAVDSEINTSYAVLGDFSATQITFRNKVTADRITATGDLNVSAAFSWLRSRGSEFEQSVSIGGSCEKSADFNGCVFRGPVDIRGTWNGEFSLQRAQFLDFVEIRGGWNIFVTAGGGPPKTADPKLCFSRANKLTGHQIHASE